ncbi:MAG: M24 family metallopeptidase, partial [Pseudolabrys sp.]|nr:M24 family metallopeptidase [Pseudolabrys sp.]
QYVDGTTDVTRTVWTGPDAPPEVLRDRVTRVLKGHIAVATCQFPEGVSGPHLDSFARRALWDAGLDFDHGTGHGVGSYLSVHEGPASISKRGAVALKRGMILSNEPGYYKPGHYGIRIENLVLVVEGPQPSQGEKALNSFETLSLAPIERRLIEPGMLTEIERDWLDGYHRRVAATLSPLLDAQTQSWLAAATKPIGAN